MQESTLHDAVDARIHEGKGQYLGLHWGACFLASQLQARGSWTSVAEESTVFQDESTDLVMMCFPQVRVDSGPIKAE